MPFSGIYHYGLVGGRFDHQPKPLIWRVFGQSLRTCVQRKPTAAYARTQQNTQILLYRGSYSPTVGSKVGLHKGFDAHKAPDTPPGRVDDIVGGFQIVPALVGDQRIAEPSCLDRIQAVLLAPHLVDLIQLFRAGTGIRLQADVALEQSWTNPNYFLPIHRQPKYPRSGRFESRLYN